MPRQILSDLVHRRGPPRQGPATGLSPGGDHKGSPAGDQEQSSATPRWCPRNENRATNPLRLSPGGDFRQQVRQQARLVGPPRPRTRDDHSDLTNRACANHRHPTTSVGSSRPSVLSLQLLRGRRTSQARRQESDSGRRRHPQFAEIRRQGDPEAQLIGRTHADAAGRGKAERHRATAHRPRAHTTSEPSECRPPELPPQAGAQATAGVRCRWPPTERPSAVGTLRRASSLPHDSRGGRPTA